jgi:hypothetical protein
MELASIAFRIASDPQFAAALTDKFQETLANIGVRLTEDQEKAVRLLLPRYQPSLAGAEGVNVMNIEPWAL